MIEQAPPGDEQLARAAEALAEHPSAARLAALGYDVLSRQAEGRGLFVGEKFTEQRATAHALTRDDAETPLGNVLTVLERGPERPGELALLGALFVRGFGDAVDAAPHEHTAKLGRFVEHCEWLELHTPYRVLRLVERLLPSPIVRALYEQLGARVLQAKAPQSEAQARMAKAGRIALLAESRAEPARAALERLLETEGDEWVVLLAAQALGRGRSAHPSASLLSLRGPVGEAQRGAFGSALRAATGIALFSLLLRGALRLVRLEREVEVSLRGQAITLERRLRWLGRELRSDAQLRKIIDLRVARRSARFAGLHTLLATACFALGVLLAGRLAIEAVLVDEASLWLGAAALIFVSAAVDLVWSVLLPARAGNVTLEVDLGRGACGRVAGLSRPEADAFLSALEAELARARKGAPLAVA